MVSAVAVAIETPHAMTRPSASMPRMVSTVGSMWLSLEVLAELLLARCVVRVVDRGRLLHAVVDGRYILDRGCPPGDPVGVGRAAQVGGRRHAL